MPIWVQTYKDFKNKKSGQMDLNKGTNKVTCNICPTNPFLHNMSRPYFKCDNVECECEVEETDCLCLKCCAELKTETCTVTSRTRMMGAGAHLELCNDITKTGFDPNHIEIIKKIKASHKEPNFMPAKGIQRHAMLHVR